MMFESNYRRKVLDKWESESEELKLELLDKVQGGKSLTRNPIIVAFSAVIAWFVQG